LLIFPTAAQSPAQAVIFAIAANAPGIELRCRTARSSPNAPSSAIECVATFRQVTIPSSRVFLSSDVERCNSMLERTGVAAILTEQRALKAEAAAKNRS
jgi:aromatic ring hydroxylase